MTQAPNLSDKLRELLTNGGACLVGFADLSELPSSSRADMLRAISIAVPLDTAVVAAITNGPTVDYHREYDRANGLLSLLANEAADLIQEHEYHAIPAVPTTREVDAAMEGTVLPHKTVATRAGLGWIGKCALLVTEGYGSAIRLTTVLTDAELDTAAPVNQSRCGACTECVDLCPANAPSGQDWAPGVERASIYDAYACRAKADELAGAVDIDETICGICIAVCPWTKKHLSRGP